MSVKQSCKYSELHRRAEAIFAEREACLPEHIELMSASETRQLIHELLVSQVELEMCNHELRRAQVEVEAELARYIELYDHAPVGYITISEHGKILNANVTAATLLGTARDTLINKSISDYICTKDRKSFSLNCEKLLETCHNQVWKLRMLRQNNTSLPVRIEANMVQSEGCWLVYRFVFSVINKSELQEKTMGVSKQQLYM